ncbi:MAG TPA: aminopeptidase [Anaerolineales bacterium]
MTDIRVQKFAQILIDHSTQVKPGDRVAITATTAAEPAVRALYELVLERGGYPHALLDFAGENEAYYAHASDDQLDFVPLFHKMAFEEFDVLIKLRSETNTRALSNVDAARLTRRQKAMFSLIATQMRRGADGTLRWMSTLYPTPAYAMEAEMGFNEYQDFYFRACHADEGTPDPVAYWLGVKRDQQRIIDWITGHDQVALRGPNVDLKLSIKGRTFVNCYGYNNLPDGEIFTGPVEDTAEGWVRYTYPAVHQGRLVEGIELTFEKGRVVKASAQKNEDLLLKMIDSDAGARYIGEFAIGTNYGINRFSHNSLLDEKIGGSFHMALGAGYPESGSQNKSSIHWDMICDLRQDSEIRVDGELMYRNGQFVI